MGSHRGRLSSDRTRNLTHLNRQNDDGRQSTQAALQTEQVGGRHHRYAWRVILVTLPEECVKEIQLWNTMRADFHSKVLGIIVNQWANISPTLEAAFNGADVPGLLEQYPDYHTVFTMMKKDHAHQVLWRNWIDTHLTTPQRLSMLTYDKWSSSGSRNLPKLEGLEEWL